MSGQDTGARSAYLPVRYGLPAVVVAVLAAVGAGAAGYGLGVRASATVAPREDLTLTAGVPDRALVDLLADVDRTLLADPSQAVEYPAFFGEEDRVTVPLEPAVDPRTRMVVAAPRAAAAPPADVPPAGDWTLDLLRRATRSEASDLRDRLRSAGLHGWMRVRRVDGQPEWQLSVGAWGTRDEAESAQPVLARLVAEVPGVDGTLRVTSLRVSLDSDAD